MKNIFNNENTRKKEVGMTSGSFRDMMESREKQLPKIEDAIREALEDYSGQNICIVIMDEDENGEPEGATIAMAGVGGLKSQVAMSKALHQASSTAMEVLMEATKGDLQAMLQVASELADTMVHDHEDEEAEDDDEPKKKGKK